MTSRMAEGWTRFSAFSKSPRSTDKASRISAGIVCSARLMRGMIRAIAAMAGEGNSIIVDEVMDGGKWQSYAAALAAFEVRVVGLFAPLEILEARERTRGDRMIGLARWQYGRVHKGMKYDLEIDTTSATPQECAARIKAAFDL